MPALRKWGGGQNLVPFVAGPANKGRAILAPSLSECAGNHLSPSLHSINKGKPNYSKRV